MEFYYTYKKQVKIGRNGALIFGDVDATIERAVKDEAEVDIKVTCQDPFVVLNDYVVFYVFVLKWILKSILTFFFLMKSSHRLTRTLPPRTYNEDYENTDEEEEEEERREELAIKEEIIEEEELQDKNSSTTFSKPTQVPHIKDQVSVALGDS